MRRIFPALFSLLVLIAPTVVQAQFKIAVQDDVVTITGYTGPDGNVIVPVFTNVLVGSKTKTLPVLYIGDSAFYMSGLTGVTIPGSILNIGQQAFAGCVNLTNITVAATNPAYSSSNGVLLDKNQTTLIQYPVGLGGSYSMPDSVTSIGVTAFFLSSNLTSVSISDAVTNIGIAAFYECPKLASLTIPASVTNIGVLAFGGCSNLAITVAAQNAFFSSVNGLLFDKSQTTLLAYPGGLGGSYAVPESVSSIGDDAFGGCANLTSVTIPESVTNLGENAFDSCTSLTNVSLPKGLTSIGFSAFGGCSSLTSITIPGSVTNLGDYMFQNCPDLASVQFDNNAPSAVSKEFLEGTDATVYYLPGTSGWKSTFGGRPAVMLNPPIPYGSLEVTISPARVIASGIQWQVDGGTPQGSGATVLGLSVGNHTVSFQGIDYWGAPVNRTVPIKARSVARIVGTYTFEGAGIYNGLFMQAEATPEASGMLKGLKVTTAGSYSGKLLTGGRAYAVSGAFNGFGPATNYIQRTATQGGPLALVMWVNWNDPMVNVGGTVFGAVGFPWTANLTTELATNESSSSEYTAWLSPDGTPPGYGYILMTNHAGAVTLSITLADGTSFSQSVPLSGAGDLPVYGNPGDSTALLLGWIGLESGSPSGDLMWIKPASHSTSFYTNGFTNLVAVQGAPWTNPSPHIAAIDLPSGQLDISGGSLRSNLTFNVAVSSNSTLVKLPESPTNSLTGSINRKTGLLTVTFGNGTGKATSAGKGAVLQNANKAAGFFLGRTNAGSIFLQP